MKLVISTQFKENYGAHDWDGTGECPQYWKFKGGDTFVMSGPTTEEDAKNITRFVEYADDGSQEYVISTEVMEDDAVVCEEWETPWNVYKELDGSYYASRFVKAEDYWKPGFKGKAQSYLMQPCGQQAHFLNEFIKEEEVV
jgi:hypothetical protein|tara:strand:- start:451 stop:873 length:423 start_codon:yes stop_codon:yes gene_type:complete